MTSGTKIFLAVFAAFIGILVLYYGVLSPAGEPATALSATTGDGTKPSGGGPLPGRLRPHPTESPQNSQLESDSTPLDSASPDGVLTESVQSMRYEPTAFLDAVGPPAALATTLQDQSGSQSPPIANQGISLSDPAPSQGANPLPAVVDPLNESGRPDVRPAVPTPKPQIKPSPANPTSKREQMPNSNSTTEYAVQSGDTMSSIAEDWFGDRNKWSLIARENPLADPNHLKIGQKLRLPPKNATPESIKSSATKQASESKSTYTVRSGDTLAKIAREIYGDVSKWELIYKANRSVIGNDPADLKTGMKLTLPPKN